jgi:hypothetical protein
MAGSKDGIDKEAEEDEGMDQGGEEGMDKTEGETARASPAPHLSPLRHSSPPRPPDAGGRPLSPQPSRRIDTHTAVEEGGTELPPRPRDVPA